jgi:hypothetical protein
LSNIFFATYVNASDYVANIAVVTTNDFLLSLASGAARSCWWTS